ncbi:O-antigen ligase family protein [Tenacibaculum sp. ZS6-P6]
MGFLIVPIFVIGSFYDSRLAIGNFNLTILLSFLFFLGVLLSLRKGLNKTMFLSWLSFSTFIIVVAAINSIFWGINEHNDYSVSKFITFTFLTFSVGVYVSSLKSQEQINIFLNQIAVVPFFLFLLGLITLLRNGFGQDRLAVLGGGPIVFSRWMGYLFLILFFQSKFKNIIKIPIMILCVLLMLSSGSKGPISFLLLLIILVGIKNRKIIFSFFVIFIIALFNANYLLGKIDDYPIIKRVFGIGDSASYTGGSSTSARLKLLNDAIESIFANPFGYGLGNYSVYSDFKKINGLSGYPHNLFVEIWLEHGILILLLFVIIFIKCLRIVKSVLIGKKRGADNRQLAAAIWFFYLLNSMVSGDFNDNRLLLVFTLLLILSNKIYKKKNEDIIHTSIL